jgi:hypothetical protein
MRDEICSVKQAVKFGIGAGLPPDKQTSAVNTVKCQTTSTPPPPPPPPPPAGDNTQQY